MTEYASIPSENLVAIAKGSGTLNTQWAFIHYFEDILPAIMLGYLCNKYSMHMPTAGRESQLHKGGFFLTNENIKKDLYFSKERSNRLLKILEKDGVIETKFIKLTDAPRRYIFLNWEKIDQMIDCTTRSTCGKSAGRDDGKAADHLIRNKQEDKKQEERIATSASQKVKRVPAGFFEEIKNHWNSKEHLSKFKGTPRQMEMLKDLIKKKKYELKEIKDAIDNYEQVMALGHRGWWQCSWTILEFLQREKAYLKFWPENFDLKSFFKGTQDAMESSRTFWDVTDNEDEPKADEAGLAFMEAIYKQQQEEIQKEEERKRKMQCND